MSAGFGYNNGPSRCNAFFTEFMKCYAGAEDPQECVLTKEDYLECLHRTKEIARAKQIKSHFLQKTVNEQSDVRKAAEEGAKGVIVSLGLIKAEGDEEK